MNVKSIHVCAVLLMSMMVSVLASGCSAMVPAVMPTPDWQPMPTHFYELLPSDASQYSHYAPSEGFDFHLEFDYPGYWWLLERSDEVGIEQVSLGDPRFLTLPTPDPFNHHPTPNDFGSVLIWIMPGKPGRTPEAELESHKQSYSDTHWMTVLNDYKIKIDGYDAFVLEYQVNDPEHYTSLMFAKRTYFMVENRVYEIMFEVAEKDRGGEFEEGYEYFLNSLKIVP